MPLAPDTIEEISLFVQAGFEDRERLLEIFLEELYAPGDLDTQEVEVALDLEIARHEAEKASWTEATDCDRLERAFATLRGHGVIALHNAGNTQSDGYSDFQEALGDDPDPSRVQGYCFYHWQDVERAILGQGLYLAFGPADPKDEESRGPAVGSIVASTLKDEGLKVEWDGSFEERILIPGFLWKRR